MGTLLILAAPYLAIMLWAWDRRRTALGIIACAALMVAEGLTAAHLILAGVR